MRSHHWFVLASAALSACTVTEGGFDGSFFDDAGSLFDDAGTRFDGAAGQDDDGGMIPDGGMPDVIMGTGLPDAAPPEQLEPSDVPGVFAAGLCGALDACMGPTLLAASLKGNDCVQFTTRQLADRHLHWLPTAVTVRNSAVDFHPELLETCKQDLIALGCSVTSRRLPDSCLRAVQGKADLDQICAIDQECVGGMFCDKGTPETCPGYCARLQKAGLPCSNSQQCADGLVCSAGNCAVPLGEGDACSKRMGGECPPGLVCQGTSDNLKCQSIEAVYAGKLDAVCDLYGTLCQPGLVCQSQSSKSTMGTCAKPAEAGGTCYAAEPSQCPANQYCKAADAQKLVAPGVAGTCTDRPTEGQDCSVLLGGLPDCAPGFACVGDPPTCRALKSAGGECVGRAECYGGACEPDPLDDTRSVCAVTTPDCY